MLVAFTLEWWLPGECSHDYRQERVEESASVQWKELAQWGVFPSSLTKATISEAGDPIPPVVVGLQWPKASLLTRKKNQEYCSLAHYCSLSTAFLRAGVPCNGLWKMGPKTMRNH